MYYKTKKSTSLLFWHMFFAQYRRSFWLTMTWFLIYVVHIGVESCQRLSETISIFFSFQIERNKEITDNFFLIVNQSEFSFIHNNIRWKFIVRSRFLFFKIERNMIVLTIYFILWIKLNFVWFAIKNKLSVPSCSIDEL